MIELRTNTTLPRPTASSGEFDSVVEVVSPDHVAGWNAAIQAFRNGNIFHTTAWASVLTETYGYKPCYLMQRQNDNFQGVLPLVEVNSRLTGRRGVSLPFTDFCPILADNSVLRDRLFEAAVEYGKCRRWRYLDCRCGALPANEATPSISYLEHVVELADDHTAAKRLRSEVRTAIRKAEGAEVLVIVKQNLDAVKCFYRLHCRTRRKHGLPPQPFSFFANICKHLLQNNLGSVFLAFHRKIPVAGAVFFHFNGQVVYKFGASDERFQEVRGNNLIFWEAIKLFFRQGYRLLSLGRCSKRDTGLRRFKSGWGAEEREAAYFRYDLRTCSFMPMKDNTAGWHNRVFGHLPVAVNRLLGALLYRHLA